MFISAMKNNAWPILLRRKREQALSAVIAEEQTIAKDAPLIPGGAPGVKKKNLQQQVQFFTIAKCL